MRNLGKYKPLPDFSNLEGPAERGSSDRLAQLAICLLTGRVNHKHFIAGEANCFSH